MLKILALGFAIVACNLPVLSAQTQEWMPKMILFHVTSVQRANDSVPCKAGMCSTVKYTVEGYADIDHNPVTTQYIITCDEFINEHPHPHRDNICARFHAGNAYLAQLQSDSISFPHSMLNKDFETDYSIVSEKEIPKVSEHRDMNGTAEPREATKGPEQRNAVKGPEQLASKNGN